MTTAHNDAATAEQAHAAVMQMGSAIPAERSGPDERPPAVTRDRVRDLARRIAGATLLPGDPGFDEACATFNLLITHNPTVLVEAAGPEDVQAAVRFAAEHGLPVAVVATGHQPFESLKNCLLIKTRRLDSVTVDANRHTAVIGAGARWQHVIDETTKFGVAPLVGSTGTVAVAGYVLGGGASPTLGRKYGWAADHVRSIDLVTADGRLRHLTPTSDPDLFWAVRGGKSNFGIVTALEIDLFPVDTLYAGGLYFAGEHTADVLHTYRALIADAPEELSSSVALLRLPPLPMVPEPLRGRLVAHVRLAFLGTAPDGEDLIAPLRALAAPLIDTLGEMPIKNFSQIHQDPQDPIPYGERTTVLTDLTAEAVDTVIELMGPGSGAELTILELRHFGGAFARTPEVPNAVDNRDAGVVVWGAAMGTSEDQQPELDRLEDLIGRLAPWSTGRKYLNFMSGAEDVTWAYTTETYARLRSIKRTYDPSNIFRLNNHTIQPED